MVRYRNGRRRVESAKIVRRTFDRRRGGRRGDIRDRAVGVHRDHCRLAHRKERTAPFRRSSQTSFRFHPSLGRADSPRGSQSEPSLTKWAAPAVDSALFSSFETNVFAPITRHTGILVFQLPREGPTRKAWDALERWVRAGAGDGRRWGAKRQKVEMFTWTALLGPNGVGKTQLAKEFARSLAQRHRWGDFRGGKGIAAKLRRFGCRIGARIRRILPWMRTDGNPWDVGLVASRPDGTMDAGRLAALEHWKPRAPTFSSLTTPL